MPNHKTMLDAIQRAGAAVFDADAQLKLSVQAYAERVHAAVGSNPYHLGNDALFENWKLVARLAQTMTGMEEELRKVYQVAAELCDDEPSAVTAIPALSAPEPSSPNSVGDQNGPLAATDVKIKKVKVVERAGTSAGRRSTLPPPKKEGFNTAGLRSSNATTLLSHLTTVLNSRDFTGISQTAISAATGIPLGSMTASLKRLVATGRLVAGSSGKYKLPG